MLDVVDFASQKRRKKKTRNCSKGYNCGNSCINKGLKCRRKFTDQASNYADWLKKQASKAIEDKPSIAFATNTLLSQLVPVSQIKSDKFLSNNKKVEALTRSYISAKGAGEPIVIKRIDNVNAGNLRIPLVQYEVIDNQDKFEAAKKAKQIDLASFETTSAIIVENDAQLKDIETVRNLPRNKDLTRTLATKKLEDNNNFTALIEISNIKPPKSISSLSSDRLEIAAKAMARLGGTPVPFVVKRISKNPREKPQFEVVENEEIFWAAKRARELNRETNEVVAGYIVK